MRANWVIVFFLCFLFSCTPGKEGGDRRTSGEAKDFITSQWGIIGGNNSLNGNIADKLPDNFHLKHRFDTKTTLISNPVYSKGNIYLSGEDGTIRSIDIGSRKVNWIFRTDSVFEASPLMFLDKLFIGDINGKFYCLDSMTGALLWNREIGAQISGSANYSFSNDKELRILFGAYDSKLYCLNGDDSSLIWEFKTDGYINGTPAIAESNVIFGGCDSNIYIVDLITGNEIRRVGSGSYVPGSPSAYKSSFYVSQYEGKLLSASINTGNINWSFENDGNPFSSIPAVCEDMVITGSDDYRIYSIDRVTGEQKWSFFTGGSINTMALVASESILIGSDDGYLYMLDKLAGKELWSYDLGAPISGSPIYCDGLLITVTLNGLIQVFE